MYEFALIVLRLDMAPSREVVLGGGLSPIVLMIFQCLILDAAF